MIAIASDSLRLLETRRKMVLTYLFIRKFKFEQQIFI